MLSPRPLPSADAVIRRLDLAPHPEGGFYKETFRAPPLPLALPDRGERAASTAIYFLLRGGDFSAFHAVSSDEVWHHYLGASLELHVLDAAGVHRVVRVGPDLEAGEVPQAVVRAGEWQAARVAPPPSGPPSDDAFVLCGCTVAPGFDFRDFVMPARDALLALHPAHEDVVRALTRS